MFIYLHKNKANYERGQLMPFFIVFIVIVIIMALVTVNLSKFAFIKTDASNSADAGALAAGSVMANVFNAVAQANSEMIAAYWEFYAAVSVSFTIAIGALTVAYTSAASALGFAESALGMACGEPCTAAVLAAKATTDAGISITALGLLIKTIWAIIIAVTAYHIAQYYFYMNIRKSADEGRDSAVSIGKRFVFINSGTGSKLKEGNPPEEDSEGEALSSDEKNNYRNTFSDFLSDLEEDYSEDESYQWLDGDQRHHYVDVNVHIDPLEEYELRVAALPLASEIGLLTAALILAYKAEAFMTTAEMAYGLAMIFLEVACICQMCCLPPFGLACCACKAKMCAAAIQQLTAGIAANTSAMAMMKPIFALLPAAWAGLLPGYTITDDSSLATAFTFIICWIDDIVHNRLVTANTRQFHEGKELGLWETRYYPASETDPTMQNIRAYSIVNFQGKGSIYEPVLRHDSSIVETDNSGITYNPCPLATSQRQALLDEAVALRDKADSLDAQATDLEEQALILELAGGDPVQVAQLRASAQDLRTRAENCRIEADVKEERAQGITDDYPDCFA